MEEEEEEFIYTKSH